MQKDSDLPSYDYATFPRQFLSYRWFKPLLVALLTFVFMLVFQVVLLLVGTIWAGDINFISTIGTTYEDMNAYTGPGALVEIGSIAVVLPALALAALIVRDRPYSSYSSSRGGWNWGAFAKCMLVAIVVFGVATLVEWILCPEMDGDGVIRFTLVGAIACLVLVPFQCVAEEYLFRGLLLQAFASWTKLPVIGIVVSAVVFAAGHPYNMTGVVLIFLNGIIWGVVAWQTKGLEATSAVHIVNNLISFAYTGFGLQAATSEVDMLSLVVGLAIDAVYAAAVIFLGKKYNWFSSKGDGTEKHNARYLEKQRRKQAHRAPEAPVAPLPPEPIAAKIIKGDCPLL